MGKRWLLCVVWASNADKLSARTCIMQILVSQAVSLRECAANVVLLCMHIAMHCSKHLCMCALACSIVPHRKPSKSCRGLKSSSCSAGSCTQLHVSQASLPIACGGCHYQHALFGVHDCTRCKRVYFKSTNDIYSGNAQRSTWSFAVKHLFP